MNTSTFARITKKAILGCTLLIMCNLLYAQKTGEKNSWLNNWTINLNGGSTQYWGYINSRNLSTTLKHGPTWGYGLVLSHPISHIIGIRGEFLMGKLEGRKDLFSDDVPANLHYSSDFVETNLSAKVNFTDLIMGYKPNRIYTVYGLVGIGFSNFQGKTENYYTHEVVVDFGRGIGKGINGYELDGVGTVGLGLKIKLKKELDFTFENSMKFIHTNKLLERNGKFPFDLYGYSSLGLSYNFGFKKAEKIVTETKKVTPAQTKPVIANNKPIEVKKKTAPVTAPVKTEQKPAPVKTEPQPEVKKEVVTPVKQEPKVIPSEQVKQQEVKPVEKEVKPIEKGVLFTGYKVQILAKLTQGSFDDIMLKFKLNEQIREDHSDKWYRYSVGEFKTFMEANIYRKKLQTKNKLRDAFVVKFVDGKRITPVWK